METPLVSVVTMTYNQAKYLEECIQSVQNQSYPNIEHIVVNDGSTDNTKEICDKYAGKIRYIEHETNKGAGEALCTGIKASKGKYVAWLSSDDKYGAELIGRSVQLLEADDNVEITYTDFWHIDKSGKITDEFKSPIIHPLDFARVMITDNFINSSTPVMRRSVYEKVGMPDTVIKADIDGNFWLRATAKCIFKLIPETLGFYRVYDGQMTTNKKLSYQTKDFNKTMALIQWHRPNVLFRSNDPALWSRAYREIAESLESVELYKSALIALELSMKYGIKKEEDEAYMRVLESKIRQQIKSWE